jgi:hypothetical protein
MKKRSLKKHLELKTYEIKGIKVLVEIDYDKKTISLMKDRHNPKHYIFAAREIEYMSGWRTILDAIKVAIGEAETELRAHIEEQEKEMADMMIRVAKAEKPF